MWLSFKLKITILLVLSTLNYGCVFHFAAPPIQDIQPQNDRNLQNNKKTINPTQTAPDKLLKFNPDEPCPPEYDTWSAIDGCIKKYNNQPSDEDIKKQAMISYQNEDYTKALQNWLILAKKGDKNAQAWVGYMNQNGLGTDKNLTEALNWYIKAAKQNEANAQNNLGYMYEHGILVVKNYTESLKWYELAATNGNINSMLETGKFYLEGKGTTENYSKAFIWFTQAADKQNMYAQNYIGYMYQNGLLVEKNQSEALNWYMLSAKQGYSNAQNQLGLIYLNGEGTEKNYSEAFKWFMKSAEQKNMDAQYNLGYMYEKGLLVNQNYAQAIKWYELSAKNGHKYAQNWLAIAYENGNENLKRNIKQAIKWHTLSANQGVKNSMKRLGAIFEIEKGHIPESIKWYELAANAGDLESKLALGNIYETDKNSFRRDHRSALKWYLKYYEDKPDDLKVIQKIIELKLNGDGSVQDPKDAINWLIKATQKGDSDAQNILGVMYTKDRYIKQDLEQAFNLFTQAKNGGNKYAYNNLGVMYADGLYVKKDINKALELFTTAAKNQEILVYNNMLNMIKRTKDEDLDLTLFLNKIEKYNEKDQQTEDPNFWARTPQMQNIMGMIYWRGRDNRFKSNSKFKTDYTEALKWFKKSAEQGYKKAYFNYKNLIRFAGKDYYPEELLELNIKEEDLKEEPNINDIYLRLDI